MWSVTVRQELRGPMVDFALAGEGMPLEEFAFWVEFGGARTPFDLRATPSLPLSDIPAGGTFCFTTWCCR